ncbi:MAG: DUF1566 domain-containing protein [Rhizobiales bacterium]|nr:DUF1566 domain-containing protein [Hyphomicrobiales bacterium]
MRPELQEGEIYAGIVLGKNGSKDHHLIVLPGTAAPLTWKKACEWATERGGELPTRREQAILYGNRPEAFEKDWYWSAEQPASSSDYAWFQLFHNGLQTYSLKRLKLRVRAVRRVAIER